MTFKASQPNASPHLKTGRARDPGDALQHVSFARGLNGVGQIHQQHPYRPDGVSDSKLFEPDVIGFQNVENGHTRATVNIKPITIGIEGKACRTATSRKRCFVACIDSEMLRVTLE